MVAYKKRLYDFSSPAVTKEEQELLERANQHLDAPSIEEGEKGRQVKGVIIFSA